MKTFIYYGLLSLIVLANCQENNARVKDVVKSGAKKSDEKVNASSLRNNKEAENVSGAGDKGDENVAGVTAKNVDEGDNDYDEFVEYDEINENVAEGAKSSEVATTTAPTNENHKHKHGVHGSGNGHNEPDIVLSPQGIYVFWPFDLPAVGNRFKQGSSRPNYGHPRRGFGYRPYGLLDKLLALKQKFISNFNVLPVDYPFDI